MYDHVSICMPSVQPQELTGQWALWLQVPAPHLCRKPLPTLLHCMPSWNTPMGSSVPFGRPNDWEMSKMSKIGLGPFYPLPAHRGSRGSDKPALLPRRYGAVERRLRPISRDDGSTFEPLKLRRQRFRKLVYVLFMSFIRAVRKDVSRSRCKTRLMPRPMVMQSSAAWPIATSGA